MADVVIQGANDSTIVVDIDPASTVVNIYSGAGDGGSIPAGNTWQSIDTQTGSVSEGESMQDIANAPSQFAAENVPQTDTAYGTDGADYYTPGSPAHGAPTLTELGAIIVPIYFKFPGDYRLAQYAYAHRNKSNLSYASVNGTWGSFAFTAAEDAWQYDEFSASGTYNIPSPGVYPVVILPRHDGIIVGRIVLSVDAAFDPADYDGPGIAQTPIGPEPTEGAVGTHETIAPENGSIVQLASTLSGSADSVFSADDYVVVLDDLDGAVVLGTDGVITHSFSGSITTQVKIYNESIKQFEPFSITTAGSAAALPALTVDADVYEGKTVSFDANTDITGLSNLAVRFDGVELPAITITDAANGLFTATFNNPGVLIKSGVAIDLARSNGTSISTGTTNVVFRPSGGLVSPMIAEHAALYPEAVAVDEDGNTSYAEQIELHGDGNYSAFIEGQWEGTYAVSTLRALSGDIVIDLSGIAAGDYTWTNAPWTNFDDVQWESSGTGLRIKGSAVTPFSRIIYSSAVINADVISSRVEVDLSAQDHISAGLAQDDGCTVFAKYAGNGRFDLFKADVGGNQTGLKQATLPTVPDGPVVVEARWSNTGDIASLLVGNFPLLSTEVGNFNPTRAAIVAVGENQNLSELRGFALQGITETIIGALNGSGSTPTVRDGDALTIQWTNDNNESSYTLTDSKGNTVTQTATVVSSNEDQITLSIPNFWYGPVTVSDPVGISREIDYAPPAGWDYVNLDPMIDVTGSTANWTAGSQVSHERLSNLSNEVNITPLGIIEIGGGFPQYVVTRENPGSSREAAENNYIFQDIREDFTPFPLRNVISGTSVSINLGSAYNTTVGIPEDEAGSAGVLTFTTSLPSGLTRSGNLISGTLSNGKYSVPLSVTDPAGNVQASTLLINVGQPDIESITVSGIMPTSVTVTVDVESFSGSSIFAVYVVALPLGSTLPTDLQVIAGTDASDATVPNSSVGAANGIAGTTISGLTPNTNYIFQAVAVGSNAQTTSQTLNNETSGYVTPNPAQTPFAGSRSKKSAQKRISSNRKRNSRR